LAEQKRTQLAIFDVIERDEQEWATKLRERGEKEEDEYDPYAEEIIIHKRPSSVASREIGSIHKILGK